MPPLKYHPGQVAVQVEANTQPLADHLAHWVGPVAEFATGADMFLFATAAEGGALHFTVLSGPAPLAEVAGPAALRMAFPGCGPRPAAGRVGGLAISLGLARRARINGELSDVGGQPELQADETFTLCRKYMAPSLSAGCEPHAGPTASEPLELDDPYLSDLLSCAETSFLASVSPDGGPDVAHRGGPAGFLTLDPATRTLTWPEFVGDGVFKSAGNVRATGRLTLLVVDTGTGDGVELIGSGGYANVRTQRSARLDPLVQFRDHYPLQGTMTCTIERALRLRGLMHPRTRIEKALKVTSSSTVDDQAPQ
jgi:hypothetical protein